MYGLFSPSVYDIDRVRSSFVYEVVMTLTGFADLWHMQLKRKGLSDQETFREHDP